MASDEWRDEALCATEAFKEAAKLAGVRSDPSEIFFPVTETDDGKPVTNKPRHKTYKQREGRFERIARQTCAECPVWKECLFTNMTLESEPYGIVGRLDAASRVALMESDNPAIIEGECRCGVKLFGAKGAMPKVCSGNCRG